MDKNRHKIKQLEVMVADVIKEAHDTTTLVLFTGNDHLEYQPGHFLTISPHQFPALERWVDYLEEIKGKKEPARAYSLSSSPHEKYLAITVKEERYIKGVTKYPPLLSPILAMRTRVGRKMVITGFTGPYQLTDEMRSKSNEFLHICAGSGVVPSYSIIKYDLQNFENTKHTLLFSNKVYEDIIFYNQLEALQKQYPDRFNVIFTLTREKHKSYFGNQIRSGRISGELISEVVATPENVSVFACGPDHTKFSKKEASENGIILQPSFMESVIANLKEVGISENRIVKESYG